ncbi:MAG: CaiB/BaiF CoA-transferase family protein [Phenylobacterium sp.]|uniref:CaiB/BaiF CoA transferase family protein n=1 Tax=Phenylobacterium sp. TaxID=1871053 RepID=UPI002736E812|nr:CaiB/BaiF CoA-transferase family protein [Phenylobacterium sp.]MDP3747609.1 CaiB/BaiF CoA-transferase family protein [Phenylobacterium sp.]
MAETLPGQRQGPLRGLRVLEFAGIGPAPFCGMLLSDLGADVLRIDRPGTVGGEPSDVTARGRRSVVMNLKSPEAVDAALNLLESADVLIEGFRPGVMERLGLGPSVALKRNRALVYGRMTGWGQDGPWAHAAGHDLNYIALSGALSAIGTRDKPVAPLNLIGDYGGGALYLAFGVVSAVLYARETGVGQIVDAAMSDGAASLMSLFFGFKAAGNWREERASNLLDGGAYFYDTYQCADGKWISLAAIEPQFRAELLRRIGIDDPAFEPQSDDPQAWASLRVKLADVIMLKSQAEWCEVLGGTDACYAPVLTLEEAVAHPHNRARQTFVEIAGVVQPAPAPRFSASPGAVQGPPPAIGRHNEEALVDWGFSHEAIERLRGAGALWGPS